MTTVRRNSSSSPEIIAPFVDTPTILEGCLAINKPTGITSAQVLRDMQSHFDPSTFFGPWLKREAANRDREGNYQRGRRRRSKQEMKVKIGHGGTLDPLATGVLITGIGRGTKELQSFLDCTKSYECVVLFGAATDTCDRQGKIVGRKAYSHITEGQVREALGKFRGKIMQRPPIYSAIHIQGKRLYEYAREGLEVPTEIPERPVEVEELEMLEWMEGGTHSYEWPNEEAWKEEKVVAEKHLIVDGEAGTASKFDKSVAKRKRSETPTSAARTMEEDKRMKVGDHSEMMSGALNPKAATPEDAHPPEVPGGETPMSPRPASEKPSTEQPSVPNSSAAKPPAARLRMTVTSGFYVRTLCQDLGEAVGSLGLMSELIRTRQAGFQLGENVLEYSDLGKGEDVWGPQVEKMLSEWTAQQSTK